MTSFRERYLDSEYLHSIRMRPELSEFMHRFKFKSVSLTFESQDMKLIFEVDPDHLEVPSVPELLEIMMKEWKWSSPGHDQEITIKLPTPVKDPPSRIHRVPIMPVMCQETKNQVYPVGLWIQRLEDLMGVKLTNSQNLPASQINYPNLPPSQVNSPSSHPIVVTLERKPWIGVQLVDSALLDPVIMWQGNLKQLKDQVNLILRHSDNLIIKVLRPETVNLDQIHKNRENPSISEIVSHGDNFSEWDIYDETQSINVLGDLILADRCDQPRWSREWWDQHQLPDLIPLGLIHKQQDHHLEVTGIPDLGLQFDFNEAANLSIVGLLDRGMIITT